MRPILDGAEHAEKKKKKLDKLIQKYYGKIDLLAAWHEHPNPDVEYHPGLKSPTENPQKRPVIPRPR